jgi:TonB family protein
MAVSPIGIASESIPNRRLVTRRALLPPMVAADFAFQEGVLLRDLSETGVGAQAVVSPAPGTTTDCTFELPDCGRIQAIGTVTWSDKTGRFGLHFDVIEDGDRGRLTQWLSRQAPQDYGPAMVTSAPAVRVPEVRDPETELRNLRQQLVSGRLSTDAAMQILVDSLRAITGATGAAIAVQSGENIVCRAASGAAPPVGAAVDRNAGLSGECLRTADVVRCSDTETDPRVDAALCRRLELRSAVIVPVFRAGEVAGLVELFFSRPHAFQNNAVRLLGKSAQVITIIAWPQTAPGTLAEASGEAALAAPEKPKTAAPAKTAPEVSSRQPDAVPVMALPSPAEAPAAVEQQKTAIAARTVRVPLAVPDAIVDTAAPLPTPVEPAPTAEHADAVLAELRARKVAELTAAQIAADKAAAAGAAEAAAPVPEFLRTLEPEPRTISRRTMVLIGAVLAVAAAIAVWQFWPNAPRPQAVPAAAIPAAKPAAPQPPSAAPTDESAQPPATTARANPLRPPAPKRATPEEVADEVIVTPAPMPMRGASAPDPATADVPAPPPLLTGAAPPGNGVASLLAAPVSVPVLAHVTTSTGLTGGKLKSRVAPVYPAARQMNISGTVVLKATVSPAGRVTRVTVVSGSPVLAAAAEAAVRRWVYEPFRLNGQPVETDTQITVKFDAP